MGRIMDAPDHVWSKISFIGYVSLYVITTLVGLALGYSDVLWIWLAFVLLGWESESDCKCDSCTEEEVDALERLKRRRVEGEITESEFNSKLEEISGVERTEDKTINELETR